MLKDLKESLSSSRKPDITHVRKHFMSYVSRPAELGSDKYERGNYLRPTGDGPHTEPTRADFERLRAYARAAVSHIGEMLQSMEAHQALDPQLVDVEGMKRAAYAIDLDVTPGGKVGASKLPHIAPACTSLMMAIEQAVACGLLPVDPGTPWRETISKPSDRAVGQAFKIYTSPEQLIADGFDPNSSAVALAHRAFNVNTQTYAELKSTTFVPVPGDDVNPVMWAAAQLHANHEAAARDRERQLAAEKQLAERELDPSTPTLPGHHDPHAYAGARGKR